VITAGKHETVPVASIELDRANPRIRKFLEMCPDAVTPDQIYQALGAENQGSQLTYPIPFDEPRPSISVVSAHR
jgi:hypothetical protein